MPFQVPFSNEQNSLTVVVEVAFQKSFLKKGFPDIWKQL